MDPAYVLEWRATLGLGGGGHVRAEAGPASEIVVIGGAQHR